MILTNSGIPVPTVSMDAQERNGSGPVIAADDASHSPRTESKRVSRVLITDSTYKHSIALARYVKRELPRLHLTGWTKLSPEKTFVRMVESRISKWYSCFDNLIRTPSLEDVLGTSQFDMVIPVGGKSVLEVSRIRPELCILPTWTQLEMCYDKTKTLAFAKETGVPVPETFFVASLEDEIPQLASFPCVVKPSREATSWKAVNYCRSQEQLKSVVQKQLHKLRNDAGAGVLIQEYITGKGHGFFALMDHGRPLRIFMHERLREIPHTGGASCAARSFWSARLKELSLKLLGKLEWNGVAMVEFKFDPRKEDFVLMEINGKFWGSLELALSAGVNFGADMIRLFSGEKLEYNEEYDRNRHFYWPLDGDLETLFATRSLGKIRDYWQPQAVCDMGHSFRADLCKTAALLKHLLVR